MTKKKSKAKPRKAAARARRPRTGDRTQARAPAQAARAAEPAAQPSDAPVATRERARASETDPVAIVGVGASAGGLEAFTQLLGALPGDTGLALVLVQHLAPQHESALAHLLAGATVLPVREAEEGMRVERDHVYVIPPNTEMTMVDGKLHLAPRPARPMPHAPIDVFLAALAQDAQSRAIGVVLSGTASDGAAGLRQIKAEGGIALAQDPESARYDSMPRAAIATGAVDLVLPPAGIAQELVRVALHPYLRHHRLPARGDELHLGDGQRQRVFALLRRLTGIDFSLYKPPTIKRRLQRRMALHRLTDVDQYVQLLEQNPDEVSSLYSDILIRVTSFFRDPASFEALQNVVLPQIVERHGDQTVRVWVPGCSTGEEAYSVAIVLLELLDQRDQHMPIQIFATDVSEAAIERARTGLYPEQIGADVTPERLRRFFTRTDGQYKINKAVRDVCVLARQDLTRDPPFSKLDLIVCRNVLIYLGTPLQEKLISVFHYALAPGGFLMLGSAETAGLQTRLFTVADKQHRIYRKKAAAPPPGVTFPLDAVPLPRLVRRRSTAPSQGLNAMQGEATRVLLSRYAPSGVLVDDSLQILQFRGQTGPFLEPAPGEASLSLMKMARNGLLHGLRVALAESRRTNAAARREDLTVRAEGAARQVNLEVVPLGSAEERYFLVLFEEPGRAARRPAARGGASQGKGQPSPQQGQGHKSRARRAQEQQESHAVVAQLHQELEASRTYLQSTIQDLEAANEELQSANEEILSSNEELQSTNEELDTAKEELQSTNEELNTLNEELQGRNEEMSRINSDLVNLLGSVQIAIVIVDNDLRIRRFTPMAESVLNLIPTDVGRSIAQIKPNIDCPDLEALITGVVENAIMAQREVQDRQGKWHSLTIRPYKNLDKQIDGAVLALFDIDRARRQELEMRLARNYASAIVETMRTPLLVLDADLRVQTANRAFRQTFQVDVDATEGQRIWELGNGEWDVPALRTLLEAVLPKDQRFDDFRVEHDFPRIGHRVMLISGRRFEGEERMAFILLLVQDVTGA